MKKKREIMSQNTEFDRDILHRISTVGPLAPDLDKILDVNDIKMIIVIDTNQQMHVRTNFSLPGKKWGFDSSMCMWSITCKSDPGEPKHWVKEYNWIQKWCKLKHDPEKGGPCP